jgi:small basic protein
MTYRAFSTIMFGMTMLGFALGLVLGIYLHSKTGNHMWAYLAVPFMGLGSGVAAYGTLRAKKNRENAEENDG